MTLMIVGLLLFFSAHFFTALARGPREQVIARMGEGGYKILYSILALSGFALIVFGWPNADVTALYYTPYFLRHINYLLMLFAIVLLVVSYAPAGKIAHAVKHPMLAGVKIWAFAHLLVNGEVRSVLVFGAFLVFAVVDRIAVKRRNAPVRPAGPVTNDAIAVIIGLAVYGAILFYLHPYIGGVPLVF